MYENRIVNQNGTQFTEQQRRRRRPYRQLRNLKYLFRCV